MSPLHPWGTASLPSLPLLKCQNWDKPEIFLQSAKSQWTNHKTCSKGHILPALLFVPALSLALISGDLSLQIRRDACLGCEQPVLPLSWAVAHLALPASLLSRELPHSCFPPGQEMRFAALSLLPAYFGCRKSRTTRHTCTGAALSVTLQRPWPLLPLGLSFPAFLGDYCPAEELPQSSDPRRCRAAGTSVGWLPTGAPCPRLLRAESRAGSASGWQIFVCFPSFLLLTLQERYVHAGTCIQMSPCGWQLNHASPIFFFEPGPR